MPKHQRQMAKSLQSIFDRAVALKKQRKLSEAIELYKNAVKKYPNSAAAEHNLAGALGDAGRAIEAEAHIRRAFSKGLNAPESWLVLARALTTQGRLEEARDAFVKTLELNPSVLDAHRELAQLVWMTTGDSAAALAPLESTMRSFPDTAELYTIKAQVLRFTDGPAAAYRFAMTSLERWVDDVNLLSPAIDWATHAGEPEVALAMSERLMTLQPGTQSARNLRAIALFASGRADEALSIIEAMVEESPEDQHSLALLATACRILGDDRHAELYDYDQLVRSHDVTAPRGWSSLSEYLADLGEALRARHPFKTHPFANSLDGGSMIFGLLGSGEAAIEALPQAIAPAVDAHLAHLDTGSDPLRSRITDRWKIDGIWSVLLKPNGFHHDHVHPNGWLSSACYIELPNQIDEGGKQGWIKFGEPGIVTSPRLPPEHAVKPHAGTIVLFPSYMWHGTIPFGGYEPRLTIAFDIVPD